MKIAFCDFWEGFDANSFLLTKIIKSICDFQISSIKDADYLIFSTFGHQHLYAPDNCIKIFYTGENIIPDFNLCDYGISFSYLNFGDRHFRFPLYYCYDNINEQMENKHKVNVDEIIREKTKFCSLTVSNGDRHPMFKTLFEELQKYKNVDSGGKWNNNIGGAVDNKYDFDLTHKFSIVCENSSAPGYTTEKIVQAFAAGCIPIYWGDPEICKIFNNNAFINISDHKSIYEVIETIKKIDNNDNLYIQMLQTPAYLSQESNLSVQKDRCKQFLQSIFLQDKLKAQRRNRISWGNKYIKQQIEDKEPLTIKQHIKDIWKLLKAKTVKKNK